VTASNAGKQFPQADDKHRQCQKLTTRERAQTESDLGIGFTNEFDQKPKQTIESDKSPNHSAGLIALLEQPSKDQIENKSFEQGFVNL